MGLVAVSDGFTAGCLMVGSVRVGRLAGAGAIELAGLGPGVGMADCAAG